MTTAKNQVGHDAMLREQLAQLIRGGGAHLTFDEAVADIPANVRSQRLAVFPHSVWHLVEHLRIAQRDIIDYIDNSGSSLNWPDDYWPAEDGPKSQRAWEASIRGFREGIDQLAAMAEDQGVDLLQPLEHDREKCVARQIMLAADHNAYHVAQIVMIRRMLGDWA